jgi:hypothetical protein
MASDTEILAPRTKSNLDERESDPSVDTYHKARKHPEEHHVQ